MNRQVRIPLLEDDPSDAGRARAGGREADARECARVRKWLPTWSGTPRRDRRRRSRLLVGQGGRGASPVVRAPWKFGTSGQRAAGQRAAAPVWEKEYPTGSFASAAWRAITCTCGADGVRCNIRLSGERLGTLVRIGARADGQKELIAVEEGDRESTESLKTVLRDLKRRGRSWRSAAAPSERRCACDARRTRWVPQDAQVIDKVPSVPARACEALTMLHRPQLLTISPSLCNDDA
jgi:hypothetical protein